MTTLTSATTTTATNSHSDTSHSSTGTCNNNDANPSDDAPVNIQEQLLEPLETTKLFPSSSSSSRRGRGADHHHLTTLQQQHLLREVMFNTGITTISPSDYPPSFILKHFILLSILFSTNHGAVVSCLSLATARMGNLGNWQSSILYLSYTLSSLLGATLMVKSVGSRNAMFIGMSIYCIYVGTFALATTVPSIRNISAILGAFVGGIGGGFLWTAQGSYFARVSEEYALAKSLNMEQSSAWLGGIFAGIYLGLEVFMRLFSTVMIKWGWSWVAVFVGYTVLAIGSVVLMVLTKDYPLSEEEKRKNESQSVLYKSTVTFRLLWTDVKMKYMVPLCATFSLSSVFVTTFVNAEVIRVALGDGNSAYVGMFTSVTAAVGGIMSVVFGYVSQRTMIGNHMILVIGCLSFFAVSFLFVLYPDFSGWNFSSLLLVYALQGVGRATFEGALKAEFATVFEDKEAAFGNIIFQNGLVTSLGYSFAANSKCHQVGNYCIEFEDHGLHNIMVLEVMVMVSAILAIGGYQRAKKIYNREREELEMETRLLGEDHLL